MSGEEDTQKIGCRKLLNKFIFSKLPIELMCGDLIWNEVDDIKKYVYCSECQSEVKND